MKPTPFLTESQIKTRVEELAQLIASDYASVTPEAPLVCVGILKGSFIFFSDLLRKLDLPVVVDFLAASSYGQGTTSSGVVKFTLDLNISITGKQVLLVEDIVDTGLTIDYILSNLRLRRPSSLRLCSLLLKPSRLQKKVPIDYLGFTIEDRFMVGYGLDAGEKYRNLPYLSILPEGELEVNP